MKRLIGTAVLVLAVTATARAHFIFIVPPKEGRTVRVVFSDSTEPDSAKLLAKIAHAKFHIIDDKGKLIEAKPGKATDVIPIEVPGKGPAQVIGRCVYGVLAKGKEPFLLNYYARTAVGNDAPLSFKLPEKADQPLQIVLVTGTLFPTIGATLPRARVLWQGKPLSGAEVVLVGEKPITLKTDKAGEVKLDPAEGPIALRARHIEAKKGTYNGKEYSSVRHYATLVISGRSEPVGEGEKKVSRSKADPAATKLLAGARAARANWDDFPGFTADVEVNTDGKRSTGKVEVSGKGKVTLDMKGPDREWARRMITSIVAHRLDDGTTLNTPCAFADDVTDHPMGRAIRVLNDEFHSSYRIRDRQVIEVNRNMGDTRFTITVLANRQNAEKKYLPASYVVNTWVVKTGALRSSVTHHNTWKQVGKFDLPLNCIVVSASANQLVNRTLKFSKHKLLGNAP
jgi:hypothetical protein